MSTIEKRIREADFSELDEPEMSELDWQEFNEGISLFNSGEFWESHEAWEEVWKRHSENSRMFFQGLIQIAAGLHQLGRQIYHGADKHFRNALWKLRPFQPTFLGIDVRDLVMTVEAGHRQLMELGEHGLDCYDQTLVPKIKKLPSEKN
ncbi:DUF309 domain-containing protein [candidate division KSB1 bacterium]|nr:DUF309 domain-containing protein [candidate division KSB1 bacterium]NIR70660.1 DUF309 domain-containing protein [candidate division KSB1 bacterium]NIS23148.1 DUF309 domain-containing protein [candidate division KSB1 bacterium]NIT70009.1 DUF309 domain-containing protein [candidate division KSB1 bacterium]NIU23646.1 DUF309 domain-containing protein [candidate division KSB1 bacterium]